MGKVKGRPGANPTTAPQLTTDQPTSTDGQFDYDQRVVHQVDSSIWRAVYNGEFRLAIRCDVCGRWLTDGRSKRAHRGPRCASKAGA